MALPLTRRGEKSNQNLDELHKYVGFEKELQKIYDMLSLNIC